MERRPVPLAPSDGKTDKHTQAVSGRRRRQHILLQVDVLGGAGVLQMLLVVFLEGSPGDGDTRSAIKL